MITFAVTAYREGQRGAFAWIKECLAAASAHPVVDEVLVYDDGSDDVTGLVAATLGTPRLRVVAGSQNLGVMGAKIEAVARAANPWVLLCDSDNTMGPAYLDAVAALGALDPNTVYSPSFGRPSFDHRPVCGRWTLPDLPRLSAFPLFGCVVNIGNWLVNRDAFMDVVGWMRGARFDLRLPDYLGVGDRSDKKWRLVYDSFDSGFINTEWWRSGGAMEIVPGLEYDHRVKAASGTESSWDRAPLEKHRLAEVVTTELLREARMAR